MKKHIVTLNKEAVIRKPGVRECPFGLPITKACNNAGTSVDNMTLIEEVSEKEAAKFKAANRKVYIYHQTGERCKYADKIDEHHNAVHCDLGEGGEGMSDFPIRPSPYYPRVFDGIGHNGVFSYPLIGYEDYNQSRDMFSGVYSLYASTGEIPILKKSIDPDPDLANEVDNIAIKEE